MKNNILADKYLIGVRYFKRKKEFNLDELSVLEKFAQKLVAEDGSTIKLKVTGEDMKEFLATVLIPLDNKPVNGFNFGLAPETTVMEIFKDFFLDRLDFRTQIIDQSLKTFKK